MNTRTLSLLALTLGVMCMPALAQDASHAAARFEITLPEGAEIRNSTFYPEVTISPDGRYVVFANRRESPARLYRRDLREGTTVPVPGVDRGVMPFFSPDSRWLAFVSGGKLWKVPIEGGSPVELAPIENFFGGTWGPDGTIVYVPEPGGGLYAISAEGGETRRLTDSGWFPSFLPDGRSVLYNAFEPVRETIAVLDIRTGEVEPLPITGRAPVYSASGHLLFGRGHDLVAMAFDPESRTLGSHAGAVLRGVGGGLQAPRQFAVSQDGTLVYITGGRALPSEPVRVSLDGVVTPLGLPARQHRRLRVSPDGTKLAFAVQEPAREDLWVAQIDGAAPPRLLETEVTDLIDWTASSEALLVWTGPDPGAIEQLPIRDGGQAAVLFSAKEHGLKWVYADGLTPDGSQVVGRVPSEGEGNGDIALLSSGEGGEFRRLESSKQVGVEHHTGAVSPDGRWLAFVTDKSGTRELYVRLMGRTGSDRQVSGSAAGWAFYPHWSPDSRGLYYVQGGRMWRVDVGADQAEPFTEPRALFELGADIFWNSRNYTMSNFDLAPDGGSFLMLRGVGEWHPPGHISVLTHVGAAIGAALAEVR